MSQRLRLLVRGIFLYQYSFLCLRAPKRASYILSKCVLEVFNSIGDYWRNRRLCHWKIGIRMKWGHRASGMEILLYSEIYGVGSTAGDFWHNFKIQSCYFITTENICRKKKQIVSPHITFYEFTLISAYKSYILFSQWMMNRWPSHSQTQWVPVWFQSLRALQSCLIGLRAVRQFLFYMNWHQDLIR